VATDIIIWGLIGPVGVILYQVGRPENRLMFALGTTLARSIIIAIIFGVEQLVPSQDPISEDLSYLLLFFNHIAAPLVIALNFRSCAQRISTRRGAIVRATKESCSKLLRIENLVHSLVPSFRAKTLRLLPPRTWHTSSQDSYENCTIVQMDMSGFTKLSSQITAEELINLLHAIFTSIDYLAGERKIITLVRERLCRSGRGYDAPLLHCDEVTACCGAGSTSVSRLMRFLTLNPK